MELFIETTNGVNNGRTVMSYGHLVGNAPESVTIIHTVLTCSHESEVYDMEINNVVKIFDDGEFVIIVTKTGTEIQLPRNMEHSIVVKETDNPSTQDSITIIVNP